MIELYVIVSAFFGWSFISRLQRNITVFTTISNYIIFKLILSVLIGWAITPFYLIFLIGKVIKFLKVPSKT